MTLIEIARSMMQIYYLVYWSEDLNTACYLKRRRPTIAVQSRTFEEAWSGTKPNLDCLKISQHLHIFLPKEVRRKWDFKSRELIFVGYCEDSKRY